MDPTNLRRRAFQISNYSSALWAMYKAGELTYKRLQKLLKSSKTEQKRYISKANIARKDIDKIKRQVRDINRTLKHDLSLRTYRRRDTSACLSAVNTKTSVELEGLTPTYIEFALTNLRYWSEATNAWVTASPTGTASSEMTIKSVSTKAYCVNNYQVPCYVEFFVCRPKEDTSITPLNSYTNGLIDQNNPSATSPLMYLTDSDQFNSLWKIESSKKQILEPGSKLYLSYSTKKPFQYDSSFYDSHNLTYQGKYHSHLYVVRVSGVLGHDSAVAGQQGMLLGGVDIVRDIKVLVEYDSGGPSLNDYTILDNSDSFTNGGVVSSKPVADNQAYSVA